MKLKTKNVAFFILLLTPLLFLVSPTSLKATCTNPEMEITVKITNFSYNVSTINLPANACVQIKLDNASPTFHTLTVDEFNGVAGFRITASANSVNSEIILTPSVEIATKFYCDVGSHRSLGLKGDYIITESVASSSSSTTSSSSSTTSSSSSTTSSSSSVSDIVSTDCTSIDQILVIETGDLSFTVSEVVLKLDSCVMLTIRNVSPIFHTFTAKSIGAFQGINIDALANQDTSITFRAPTTPISTDYYCSVGGHRAAGMVGRLFIRNNTPSQTITTSSSTDGAVFFAIMSLIFTLSVASLISIVLSRSFQKHHSN